MIKLAASEVAALDPYKFMATIGKRELALPVRLDVHMHVDPLEGGKVETRH
jgi:hypothetical protein